MLSLYASGCLTGVCIDSGYENTSVVPIYEGYALKHGIGILSIGGNDITKKLFQCLNERQNVNVGTPRHSNHNSPILPATVTFDINSWTDLEFVLSYFFCVFFLCVYVVYVYVCICVCMSMCILCNVIRICTPAFWGPRVCVCVCFCCLWLAVFL